MRVLHVTTPAAFGGLERVVSYLAQTQRELGHDVRVACLSSDPGAVPFLRGFAQHDIPTYAGGAAPRDYWRQRRYVTDLQRTIAPDIVHTHGYRADVLAARACQRAGTAVVTTLHGFTGGGLRNRCYEWLQRRAVRVCDTVVAVSEALAGEITRSGLAPDRVQVIPNVIPPLGPRLTRAEARRVLDLPEDRWVVGWVGRVSPEKGLDVLLDALPAVQQPDLTVAVLGDGPARLALERKVDEMGLTDRVRWYGLVQRAERVFAAFDVLVISSRTEGSPIVLLEAMAATTPVITTAVGGVPDMVTSASARIIPPEDPATLAAALQEVRLDAAAAERRAMRAHVRLARTSDPVQWAERYTDAYLQARDHRRHLH